MKKNALSKNQQIPPYGTNDRILQITEMQKHANIMHQQNYLINQHPSSGIESTGLGCFSITSLSEAKPFCEVCSSASRDHCTKILSSFVGHSNFQAK
jgi:hypothetical protein